MRTNYLRTWISGVALTLLAACGGNGGDAAPAGAIAAAPLTFGPAPVADCEAEGCSRPRIIDGLAEQYRARAVEQPHDPPPTPASAGVDRPPAHPATG